MKIKSIFEHTVLLIGILASLNTCASSINEMCGKPPDIKNGEVQYQDLSSTFPLGSNITYSCHDGFSLISQGNSVCLFVNETAVWEPDVIICESTCNYLPEIGNGTLLLAGKTVPFFPGESIRYECDIQYVPKLRNSEIMCIKENGSAKWYKTEQACIFSAISCNDPGDIENAQRIGNVFTFPHSITYVCNHGFRLVGVNKKVCSNKGQWIPHSTPSCEEIYCPTLTFPQNGKIVPYQRTLGSIATYLCDRYFRLFGNSSRRCQEDGTWTADSPTCEETTCFPPKALQNVRILAVKDVYKAGDIIIFKCKYDSHQHTSSKCQENGEWSLHPPVCAGPKTEEPLYLNVTTETPTTNPDELQPKSALTCDDPGKIKNGERTFVGLTINSTITYTCDEGYELRGHAVLLCLKNGKWDRDKLPICVKPLSVPNILGIIFGVLLIIALCIGAYFLYKWRERKIRGYGKKSKALTADATDKEEIAGLDRGRRPIPVTVL